MGVVHCLRDGTFCDKEKITFDKLPDCYLRLRFIAHRVKKKKRKGKKSALLLCCCLRDEAMWIHEMKLEVCMWRQSKLMSLNNDKSYENEKNFVCKSLNRSHFVDKRTIFVFFAVHIMKLMTSISDMFMLYIFERLFIKRTQHSIDIDKSS